MNKFWKYTILTVIDIILILLAYLVKDYLAIPVFVFCLLTWLIIVAIDD